MHKHSLLSTSPPARVMVCLLIIAILKGLILIYIFLMIINVEHLFMYLLAICDFLKKCLVMSFAHFKLDFSFKYILLIMLLELSYSPHFIPLHPAHPVLPTFPLPPAPASWFMSMGHTYRFFGFSIFYTILNLPLTIFYLPFMLPFPVPFPPFPPPLSHWSMWSPGDLHFCDCVLF